MINTLQDHAAEAARFTDEKNRQQLLDMAA
jgi:hypothetical protein